MPYPPPPLRLRTLAPLAQPSHSPRRPYPPPAAAPLQQTPRRRRQPSKGTPPPAALPEGETSWTQALLQEELVSSPESWLVEKLEDNNTKVIVVESETVNECLKNNPDIEIKGGIDQLKVLSLKHIEARLSSNYRRRSVVRHRGGRGMPRGPGWEPCGSSDGQD